MAPLLLLLRLRLLAALLAVPLAAVQAAQQDLLGPSTAFTARYWDCCKPSCAWSDKGSFVGSHAVAACDAANNPLSDASIGTGCNGGTAFACAAQSPWAVNDTFAYGFVGAYLKGGTEGTWCCSCYELTFASGNIKGKKMVVQASNTDYEMPGENIFTFGIPGGNTSYANACALQYGVPGATFGVENVGVGARSDCDRLPAPLRKGCYWRFDWFEDTKAPTVDYKRVACPKVLTDITGCLRTDEATFSPATNSSATKGSAAAHASPSSLLGSAAGAALWMAAWALLA